MLRLVKLGIEHLLSVPGKWRNLMEELRHFLESQGTQGARLSRMIGEDLTFYKAVHEMMRRVSLSLSYLLGSREGQGDRFGTASSWRQWQPWQQRLKFKPEANWC
jgi:hypothetical protein